MVFKKVQNIYKIVFKLAFISDMKHFSFWWGFIDKFTMLAVYNFGLDLLHLAEIKC